MAGGGLSPAKAVLLAVQLVHKAELSTLRTLVSQHRETLRTDIVLRIILSHLPESLGSFAYVPFLCDLTDGHIIADPNSPLDTTVLDGLSEKEASKKVRKLHLLPLAWPNAPREVLEDPLTLFLIHRSLRIDENTGLITQVPALVTPFLQRSSYLRTWFISTILPLLRLNYEYHPHDGATISVPAFERLDDESGVRFLLSRTGKVVTGDSIDVTVGRDLRGLIGPWMYGNTRSKRRKVQNASDLDGTRFIHLDGEGLVADEKYASWEEVFNWVTAQAATSWKTAVHAIEQWDGPGDIDLGPYDNGSVWLNESDQQHLEQRYARSALATAYLIPEASLNALEGVQRIVLRILTLLDLDRIPTLEVAAGLLSPVSITDKGDLISPRNAALLRDGLLDDQNILTRPTGESIEFLHALLVSAYLFARERAPLTILKAGQMALRQDENQQKLELSRFVLTGPAASPSKGDDRYWSRIRNEILWMRSWGAEELGELTSTAPGKGIFGQITKEYIEIEILKGLLANSRFTLANQLYDASQDQPISTKILQETVLASAMEAYDNATNPNKTRGGIKRSHEILKAFPKALANSRASARMQHLIMVTHAVGEYRLVLKQGELFTPVALRVHGDPISIIGRILEQNPKSYTKINDFVWMGKEFVKAGLTTPKIPTDSMDEQQLREQESIAERRVVAMCVSAALAEDDFETAYSYVTTRLATIAGQAHTHSPNLDRRESPLPESAQAIMDDWSWKAALEAGRYRRTSHTTKPTHLGNASGNPEIRHLQQRMDCLAHALRFAPKATLQEILNAYRRCEEELETQLKLEVEEEDAWDTQGDDQSMPGGFGAQEKGATRSSRAVEEAPMSLFDLSRASMARAQSGLSALTSVQTKLGNIKVNTTMEDSLGYDYSAAQAQAMRKRDQLKNAATGALASGVGWLIGATPSQVSNSGDRGN